MPPDPGAGNRRRRVSDSVAEGLAVYLHDREVGVLMPTVHGIQFKYLEAIVGEATPSLWSISARLPVREKPYDHLPARAFFDNLLPERETLALIARARRLQPNDTAGLLAILGGECAGAVSLWPLGHGPPPAPKYRLFKAAELADYFDEKHSALVVDVHVRGRLALSGDRPKVVVVAASDGTYQLPQDGAPTTTVLKGGQSRYPNLVANELAGLGLMEVAGVPTVRAVLRRFGAPVLELTRFDRARAGDGRVRRLHQEDLCQATGRQALEQCSSDGVTVDEIANAIRRHSGSAATDLVQFARWVFANLCIGNEQGHAKQLALLGAVTGKRLAPAYAIVCTAVYSGAPRTLPLFIGAARTAESVSRTAITTFARQVGLDEQTMIQLATDVADRLDARARSVLEAAAAAAGGGETLEAIASIVATRVRGLRRAITSA